MAVYSVALCITFLKLFNFTLDALCIFQINNNTSILPDITLGAEIRDDCLSDTIALEESLNFVLNAFGQAGKICAEPNNPVMGVVGTVSSQTATTVASLLRLFHLSQISYGATSPDLSNRDEYEYFMRTVPSDECQAEALIDIISQLEWKAVFLISSFGNYGERIREKFVGLVENPKSGLCIVEELKIGSRTGDGSSVDPKTKKEIENFLDKINKRKTVRGVVLLTESVHSLAVLERAKHKDIPSGRFYWLATDTWGVGQNLENVEDVASGAISIALHTPSSNSLKKFYDYFRALKPGSNPKNPWFDHFWEYHFKCSISNDSGNACKGTESYRNKDEIWKDDKIAYVFDSVYAFAYGLDAMLKTTNASLGLKERLKQLSENETNLLQYLKETSFSGKSGNVSFDRNGNGVSRYDIMSYKDRNYTKITVWNEGGFIAGNIPWFEKRKQMTNSGSYCGLECKTGEGKISSGWICCRYLTISRRRRGDYKLIFRA